MTEYEYDSVGVFQQDPCWSANLKPDAYAVQVGYYSGVKVVVARAGAATLVAHQLVGYYPPRRRPASRP